tara:strand:- start:331 stop:435 length:105 start_codon:yes stop_codon:yes gene_type:complete
MIELEEKPFNERRRKKNKDMSLLFFTKLNILFYL